MGRSSYLVNVLQRIEIRLLLAAVGLLAALPASAGIPLLTTRWSQRSPYNDLCPIGDGGRTAAGCGVIAVAQIMRYHAWPPAGVGSVAYVWDGDQSCGGNIGGETLSADLDDPYDWSDMPAGCEGGCTSAQQGALAELCYEVGLASHADYGNCGTAIYPADLVAALVDRFRYEDDITGESRSWYSAQEWFDLIRGEIDARRPVLYAVPAHAIVCDGYRVEAGRNQIHVNWGDGNGSQSGWWTVDSLPGGHDPMSESLYRGIRPRCNVYADGTGDYSTIQAAVDRMPGGGVIALDAGAYRGVGNRDIDFRGRIIEIRGTSGAPGACVIDCEGAPGTPHRAFHLRSGETADTAVRDVTIRNGYAQDGGGILVSAASPTIAGCTFIDCRSEARGGSICMLESSGSVDHCTVVGSGSATGGSIFVGSDSAIQIDRTIVAFGLGGGTVGCDGAMSSSVTCCDFYGNAGGDWTGCVGGLLDDDGNLCSDPLFCDPGGGDFSLSFASVCSPARNPVCGLVGAWPVGECGAGSIVRVRPDGAGDFPTIQAAVDAAVDSVEILLADGVFRGTGNRDVNLRGKRLTIRSESDQPDVCIIDCEGSSTARRRAFRFNSGEGAGTIVRGISVIHGCPPDGSTPGVKSGGAICCRNASPTIERCIFRENQAAGIGDERGGAIALEGSSSIIRDCVFEGNSAGGGGGVYSSGGLPSIRGCRFTSNAARSGGAIWVGMNAQAAIDSVSFATNSATEYGGAVTIENATARIDSCILDRNDAQWGGGIQCTGGLLTATGCTFSGNSAYRQGGGIRSFGAVTLRACTFHANSGFGSGLYLDGTTLDAQATIISGGNAYAVRTNGTVSATLACCDLYGNVGGDWWGLIAGQLGQNGNICADPLFCDLAAGDYHLDPDSPCRPHPPVNPDCDIMGAWTVGCTSAAEDATLAIRTPALRLIGPNPSSGSVRLALTAVGPTRIEILDVTGRCVRTLRCSAEGTETIAWDGLDERGARLPSGIYCCRPKGATAIGAVRIVLLH